MNILAVTDYYRQQSDNGSEVFCSRLIRCLRQDHRVTVLARDCPGSWADIAVADGLWADGAGLGRQLLGAVAAGGYDCVYNLGGLTFGCRIVEILRFLCGDIPVVNHFQTLLEPLARIEGYDVAAAARFGAPQRQAAHRARCNIVLSRDELRLARQYLEAGPTAVVVPNGLPLAETAAVVPDRSYLPADGRDRLVIAAGGRFSDLAKGADLLYRAFARLQAEVPEAFLVVAANADRFLHLLDPVPAGRWLRLPWLGRQQFLQVLAGADLVVVPSRYEPFGLVAIEAMSLGVPVLANAVGGLAESVVPGKSGLRNALDAGSYGLLGALREACALGPPALRRLGASARDHVRRTYAIGPIAARVAGLLQRASRAAAA